MTASFTSIQKGDKTQFSTENRQIQTIYVKEGGGGGGGGTKI